MVDSGHAGTEPCQRKGSDLGGISDLAGLRRRCVVDADSGCWHWRTQTKVISMGGKIAEPRVYLRTIGGTTTIGRAAWAMSSKPQPKAERWTVWRTCGNALCGNPAHMRAGTKTQWGAWVRERHQPGTKRRAARHHARAWARPAAEMAPAARRQRVCHQPVPAADRRLRPRASVFSWRP